MTKTEAEELAEGIERLGEHLWGPLTRALNVRYRRWRWTICSMPLHGDGREACVRVWIDVARRPRG